jgi:hypothetical protein
MTDRSEMTNATSTPDESLPPDPDDEARRLEEMIEKHVMQICEHVDTVRIFITTNRGDGTYGCCTRGAGNYYAQRDSVREWLMRQDQQTRNEVSE